MSHEAARIPRVMWIPPPLLFVLTFLGGRWLGARLPLPSARGALLQAGGWVLLALGLALLLGSVALFARARTTLVPQGSAGQLVTGGPFRLTRNPMYLALALLYAGVALRLGLLGPLLLLPLLLLLLQRVIIPFEEARLRALFGAGYDAYCARVRRWL